MTSSRALRGRHPRDRASAPATASPAFLTSPGRCVACPSVRSSPSSASSSLGRGWRVPWHTDRANLRAVEARTYHDPRVLADRERAQHGFQTVEERLGVRVEEEETRLFWALPISVIARLAGRLGQRADRFIEVETSVDVIREGHAVEINGYRLQRAELSDLA